MGYSKKYRYRLRHIMSLFAIYSSLCLYLSVSHGIVFFISGFFLKVPLNFRIFDFSSFIIHKIKSIYLPFVVVNFLFLIISVPNLTGH